MVEDVVRLLGYGTLGSRLKRIGEKLQAQTQELSGEAADVDVPASHHPVLAALDRSGPMSIGSLAAALGQSQPGVTRMVHKLKAVGLVEGHTDDQDRRINRIALTDRGQELVHHLQETLWPRVMLAVKDACTGLDGPLLQQLAGLEEALDRQTLLSRSPVETLPEWAALTREMEDIS